MENLQGKVAVITGGASGIGLAMAEAFAAEGAKLVLADIEEARLEEAADGLRAKGAEVLTRRTDVRKPEEVEALANVAGSTTARHTLSAITPVSKCSATFGNTRWTTGAG